MKISVSVSFKYIMAKIRPLSAALSKIAKDELNETPERIESDLKAFKEWLVTNPHIYSCTDDQFLVAFLRGCKFSLEKAKEKLDAYYTMQTAIPQLRDGRDPLHPKTLELLKQGVLLPLPEPYEEGAPILYLARTGTYDTNVYSFADIFSIGFINTEVLLANNDNYVVCGQIFLIDMQHLTMQHAVQATPLELKRCLHFNRNAIPIRQKSIHFINAPSIFTSIYNTIKTIMPQKIVGRMMVHDSMEELHKHIPKKALPLEYGGDRGPLSELITSWENKVMEQRDRLLAEKKYGIDESKRQQKSKLFDGIDGSFRKLVVD